MVLKVYFDSVSQPSRAVLSLVKLAKLQHQAIEIRVNKGANLTPEYTVINPLKQVPAIDDNGFHLGQSHAILTYLSQAKNLDDSLYPKDLQKRARVDTYLHWHHTHTRRCHLLFETMNPRLYPNCPTTKEVEERVVHKSFKTIEDFFLQEKKYIGNMNNLSIADLSCASEIVGLKLSAFDMTPYPVLREWLKRVFENPDIRKAHEAFFKIVERKKGPIVF